MVTNYKETVFLPKTSFPMRGNLPVREPQILAHWEKADLYQKIRKSRAGAETFTLHDGPPYANGPIHLGQGLNKILKDIVNRSQHLLGNQIAFVPGWDCHGLPIEWKIEERHRKEGKDKDAIPIIQFREECRKFADNWVNHQRENFKRLGVIGDWGRPYITMDYKAEAEIVREIGKFLLSGDLFQGLRPVQWSVVEQTALADAEVEYHDHTSPSIYVRFPITQASEPSLEGASAVIWTTTPWTLPGNRGIAYGEELDYVLLTVEAINEEGLATVGETLLVAKDLQEAFKEAVGITKATVRDTIQGTTLKGTLCQHPFAGQGYDFDVPLLPGAHVTTETGTGLVHTAPGHGAEDFYIGKEFGLEVPQTVGGDGLFYDHVPLFAGLHVFKTNPIVIEKLKETKTLLHVTELVHSYPHSWRSRAPLIFRTTPQWFISMSHNGLQEKALKAIETVEWFPKNQKRRIQSMVEDRPDWCISRQRAWGVPITLFIDKKTGEPLRDAAVHERIAQAIEKEGSDVWFDGDPRRFLAPEYEAENYEAVRDIVDVWFESGSTHSFVLEDREELSWPADLYLEGSDQHRGWFQTSLLESCGTRGTAPYKQVLTHGYVVDEKGYKMSKSLGNTMAPQDVCEKSGAETLRLWVAGSDFHQDMSIGPDILKHHQDLYRRLRNTLRYLLGGLEGFSESERVEDQDMPELEKWVLHRLTDLDTLLRKSIATYEFQAFYSELHNFCAVDLSAFYFDIRKDVLYCSSVNDVKRRALRTVFDHLFRCLTIWLSPVLCFTAEEAWWARYCPDLAEGDNPVEKTSVHLQRFPDLPKTWASEVLAKRFELLRSFRKVMTGALEIERADGKIKSSLQAHLKIFDSKGILPKDLKWDELSITSGVSIVQEPVPDSAFTLEDQPDFGVIVEVASGDKCQRCWKILEDVGENPEKSDICGRCYDVVQNS